MHGLKDKNDICEFCKHWELLPFGENVGYCSHNDKNWCLNHSEFESKKKVFESECGNLLLKIWEDKLIIETKGRVYLDVEEIKDLRIAISIAKIDILRDAIRKYKNSDDAEEQQEPGELF